MCFWIMGITIIVTINILPGCPCRLFYSEVIQIQMDRQGGSISGTKLAEGLKLVEMSLTSVAPSASIANNTNSAYNLAPVFLLVSSLLFPFTSTMIPASATSLCSTTS